MEGVLFPMMVVLTELRVCCCCGEKHGGQTWQLHCCLSNVSVGCRLRGRKLCIVSRLSVAFGGAGES